MPRYESVWIATSEEPGFGALEAPIEVDVAVLGAGIAGLTTALLLKNAGLRVAVVEAAGVSRATTGHTTAKVSAQHGLIYDTLSSKFGNDGARAYGQANLAAVDLVEALVREHGIACDWERRAAYAYTEQDSQVSQIEREVDAARQAGLPASYTEETDLPWSVKAAVRFDNQAQFHPRRYCLALATLVDGDGSRVFEQTRALDVEDGSPCVVKTERHDVRAAFVVLATHLPFLDQGAFFAKCHPEREYVLAAALKQPVSKGMYNRWSSDTQHPPAPIRWRRAAHPRWRQPQDRPGRRHRKALYGARGVRQRALRRALDRVSLVHPGPDVRRSRALHRQAAAHL